MKVIFDNGSLIKLSFEVNIETAKKLMDWLFLEMGVTSNKNGK